ncbi:hypothetical protein OG311_03380 [Streptomyces sp. NBC_01343]|uniref:hypothetical protein n=1 Tax=Streptomyces sp. NBC_01343 TaxID=2903832 RepID=UPI002E15A75B|nr:hypothetical protein OG311_03380 [Streptomyces sp. NBC_01343]
MLLSLVAAVCAIIGSSALAPTPAAAAAAAADQRHPIYAIAHRVDTLGGVDAALKHGGSTPDVGGRGWKSLEGRLGGLDGITTTGTRDQARAAFDRSGSGFPAGRRVMDYGDSDITKGFGNYTEPTHYTCAELKKGAGDRDARQLAAALSWTTTHNDLWYVDELLGDGHVDGIIAGYGAFTGVREYDDGWQCANAVGLVRDWVGRHSGAHRMATPGDRLFR